MPIPILKPSLQSLYLLLCKGDRALYYGTGIVVMAGNCPVLITSRQLLTGRPPEEKKRFSKQGVPDRVKISHNRLGQLGEWVIKEEMLYDSMGKPRWIEHPTYGVQANIVALALADVFDVELYPYDLDYPGPDLFTGVGDSVYLIGYPFGLRGGPTFGVWANGVVASEPQIDHFDLPVFLLDCRTRLGQAGAAVVAHHNDGYSATTTNRYEGKYRGPVTRLLGVYGGRINRDSDLGMVWRISALKELLQGFGSGLWYDLEESKPEGVE